MTPAGRDFKNSRSVAGRAHRTGAPVPVWRQGAGVVINMSSGAAHNPLEGWSMYCASKAGAFMLTRCAHLENRGAGIRVMSLSPGTVATDMQRAIRDAGFTPHRRRQDYSLLEPATAAA